MPVTKITTRTWRLIDSGPHPGADNMRLDELLLERAVNGERVPTLRLYTWDPPAVSLGRFQDRETAVKAEACRRLGIDIVRRTTGGRAVLHQQELTYSVVSLTDNTLFPQDVLGTYKVIAMGLLAALRNLGIEAEMVSRSNRHAGLVKKKAKDPSCFSSPSWYELLVNGKKIIGSAQRRVSGAFLQHGSILIKRDPALEAAVIPGGGGGAVTSICDTLGRDVSRDEVKKAFMIGFGNALGLEFVT